MRLVSAVIYVFYPFQFGEKPHITIWVQFEFQHVAWRVCWFYSWEISPHHWGRLSADQIETQNDAESVLCKQKLDSKTSRYRSCQLILFLDGAGRRSDWQERMCLFIHYVWELLRASAQSQSAPAERKSKTGRRRGAQRRLDRWTIARQTLVATLIPSLIRSGEIPAQPISKAASGWKQEGGLLLYQSSVSSGPIRAYRRCNPSDEIHLRLFATRRPGRWNTSTTKFGGTGAASVLAVSDRLGMNHESNLCQWRR